MRARIVLIFILAAVAALTSGCGNSGKSTGERTVVAAFYPLAYAAAQVDPSVDVTDLTPAGAEPHDLELTARDVERVRAADLVLHLQGFMPALDDALGGGENAVDLLDGLRLLSRSDGDEADVDPHVWLDPLRYAAIAERVAGELGETADAAGLVDDLRKLDREYRSGLANCKRRTLVTSHAAFGYLADAYDLRQVALTGLSPEIEPSAKAIESLVAEVEKQGATTVFVETLLSPDLAETVAREAGVATAALNPLEGLTDEELEAGADYFSIMRQNLDALRRALGCS